MRSILIIEDDQHQAELLAELVRDVVPGDIEVDQATDLEGALAAVLDQHYHSLCLDINLPDSDGAATYLTLRTKAKGNIVVYTIDQRAAGRVRKVLENNDVVVTKQEDPGMVSLQIVAGAYLEAAG
jgi:DNA-binding response OmpR family regulator